MAEVQIGHAFVSTKPDSPDSSIVSSSEWNASLLFKNGASGQIPVRDTLQSTGARWTQEPNVILNSGTSAGGTSFGPLASLAVVFTTRGIVLVTTTVVCTTSAGQNVNLVLRRDGVGIRFFTSNGSGTSVVSRIDGFAEDEGSHTFDVTGSVSSGTITSVTVEGIALIIGR